MNVFDLYLIGDVESINWGFHSSHLDQRLRENGIELEYIQDMIFYEEPLDYAYIKDNRYEVFIESPEGKSYDELRLIFACGADSIDVITVMPNTLNGSYKNQTKYCSDSHKKLKKQQAKAYAKRKRMN